MLSKKVFMQGLERLEAAFRTHPLSEVSFKIYFEKLGHLDNNSFLAAVERIIDKDTFFPAIARFGEYAEEADQDRLGWENAAAARKQMRDMGYNPNDQ